MSLAPTLDTASITDPVEAVPLLEPVATADAHESAQTLEFAEAVYDESDIGRKAVTWGVIGFVAWTLGVTGGTLAYGLEPASALGLGLYVGTWSGLGFGFMMGGTTALSQILEPDQHR